MVNPPGSASGPCLRAAGDGCGWIRSRPEGAPPACGDSSSGRVRSRSDVLDVVGGNAPAPQEEPTAQEEEDRAQRPDEGGQRARAGPGGRGGGRQHAAGWRCARGYGADATRGGRAARRLGGLGRRDTASVLARESGWVVV